MLEEKMFAFAMLGSEWVLWLLVLLSVLASPLPLSACYSYINTNPLDKLQRTLSSFLKETPRVLLHQPQQSWGIEASVYNLV